MIQSIKRWLGWGGTNVAYTGGSNALSRGNFQTVSGTVINEQTALTIPAFFHALRLYGQTLGSLEWNLIEHDENRRKTIARTHPVHRLINCEPNEFQLPAAFRETIIGHAISYGNGYAYIERNGNFRPTALMPLLPDRTYPKRVNGELKYVTTVNGMEQTLEPYEVFHIPGFSVNGLTGVPLVRIMAESLGLTKAEEAYAAAYFGNNCNYGGTVKVPGRLSDEAMKNLKAQVQDNGGIGNAFRWLFLEEGMEATQSQANADKAQLVESRQYQLGDLARITGLAPHLLYDLSRSTNNNIEWQGIEAVTYSFRPWANKLTQEANRKLLYESEKGTFETVIDLKPLMQGDAKTQAERDQIRFNCAALTPNEIRELDGRNPIDGGDQLFLNVATMPLNITIQKALAEIAAAEAAAPLDPEDADEIEQAENEGQDTATGDDDPDDETGNHAPPPAGDQTYSDGPTVPAKEVEDAAPLGIARALTPVVADTVRRLMRREAKAVRGNLAKFAGDAPALDRWLETYTAETRQHVAEVLAPVAETLAGIGATAPDVGEIAASFAAATAADVRQLVAAKPADRPQAITATFERWQASRTADLITDLIGGDR